MLEQLAINQDSVALNHLTVRGVTIWLLCALFFLYEFFLRTVLGTFQQPIMSQLELTPMTFALLSSSAYQIVYSLMQIPVGFICQYFGFKKTLLIAILICVMADIGLAFAPTFGQALFWRIIMGLGSSFGFISLLISVYTWLPRTHSALFIGLSQLIGTIGPLLAAGPLYQFVKHNQLDWRAVFHGLAAIGFIIALLVYMIIDQQKKDYLPLKSYVPKRYPSSLFKLLKQPQLWSIALFSACIYFSLEYLSTNQCSHFLAQKGFSAEIASHMISLSWLSYAVACPLLGYISDKIKRRKQIMIISSISTFIALSSIIYLPLSELMVIICFIVMGAGASGQSIGFAIMAEQCQEADVAISLGFNNAMIGFITALAAPLIGAILIVNNTLFTPLVNYQRSFIVIMGLAFTAVILSIFFIKETRCTSIYANQSDD